MESRLPHSLILIASLLFAQGVNAGAIKHVIVIAMENTDADEMYGKAKRAPYLNKEIMPNFARAGNFNDPLPIKVLTNGVSL